MPRLRGGWVYDRSCGAILDLMMGPTDAPGELTIEQLEVAWAVERGEIMEDCRRNPSPGWRPWGHWFFDLGEPPPPTDQGQVLRLLELGELTGAEVEQVRERALSALAEAERADRLEDVAAVRTGPIGAAQRMRERRAEQGVAWREVLAAAREYG